MLVPVLSQPLCPTGSLLNAIGIPSEVELALAIVGYVPQQDPLNLGKTGQRCGALCEVQHQPRLETRIRYRQ
jgi:hypothetical protein